MNDCILGKKIIKEKRKGEEEEEESR